MMKPLGLTVLLLIACLQGAKAADKDLGEDCTTGTDTCVHPSLELVCDDVTATCLIKQGKSCSGDGHGGLCVTGAACSSGTCTCGTAYAANANGKCDIPANLWGAICTYDAGNAEGDCTASSGLACPSGATTRCTCEDDKHVDLATGKCTVAIAATKVGTKCTDQTECGTKATTHLECPTGGGVCGCEAGYTGSIGADCAQIPAQKKGHSCDPGTATTDCGAMATTHLQCDSSPDVCGCASNYYGVTAGVCYPEAGQLNGGCSDTSACSAVSNTVCTGSTAVKKCVCATGYSVNTAGIACEITPKKVGGACTGGPDKQGTCEDANAECSGDTSGTCTCKDGYSGPDGGSCVVNNKVGGACTGTADTQASCEDTNALCTSSICTCKDGYSGTTGGSCTKIADNKVGGSCTATTANTQGTCEDANAVCPQTTGGFCECTIGYAGIPGGGCAQPNKLGGECTTETKDTKGTCEDSNAVCSAQVNGRCYVKNGAMGMAASVTSLLLVAIVCLLAMN